MKKYQYTYHFPIGKLTIVVSDEALHAISNTTQFSYEEKEHPLILKTKQQLDEYFNGTRTTFTIPCHLEGTAFQIKAWETLMEIPYGQTISYQKQATQMGNVLSVRAVGGANHHNPVMIIIPCHRVIGKNGSMTGYGGGIGVKEYLLKLEQNRK